MCFASFSPHKNIHTQTTASPSTLITWVCSYSCYLHCWWMFKIQIILLSCEWSEESDGSISAPQSAHHHFPNKYLGICIKSGASYTTRAFKHLFCFEMALKAVVHIEWNNFKNPSEIVQKWSKLVLLLCSLFRCGCLWYSWKVNREICCHDNHRLLWLSIQFDIVKYKSIQFDIVI